MMPHFDPSLLSKFTTIVNRRYHRNTDDAASDPGISFFTAGLLVSPEEKQLNQQLSIAQANLRSAKETLSTLRGSSTITPPSFGRGGRHSELRNLS